MADKQLSFGSWFRACPDCDGMRVYWHTQRWVVCQLCDGTGTVFDEVGYARYLEEWGAPPSR